MCLSHYFIFSLSAQSGQQNSDWNVVLATSGGHSQILCSFISRLSCVNAAVSVVFSHLLHFTNSAVCISTWASAAGFSTTMSVDDWYDVAVLWTEWLVFACQQITYWQLICYLECFTLSGDQMLSCVLGRSSVCGFVTRWLWAEELGPPQERWEERKVNHFHVVITKFLALTLFLWNYTRTAPGLKSSRTTEFTHKSQFLGWDDT